MSDLNIFPCLQVLVVEMMELRLLVSFLDGVMSEHLGVIATIVVKTDRDASWDVREMVMPPIISMLRL